MNEPEDGWCGRVLLNCRRRTFKVPIPVKLFRRRMQNYATLCDKFIQHYATLCIPRRYIASFLQPYRRERLFLWR